MTFKSAYIRLTIYYVLIVMSISIMFSVVIYRLSSREINRGLDRQVRVFQRMPHGQIIPDLEINIAKVHDDQLNESLDNLINQLFYFNLAILLLSAVGSYFFAKKTLEPIEEMVENQNHFTADASHELKTPLAAMRSEIEVGLRDKKFDLKSAKEMLESNLEEIERLESLSNALLKLARYQNEVQINFQKLSIENLIVSAYEKIESLAQDKKIVFDNKLEDFQIKGDRQSLIELFVILLDNAIKYSPEKSTVRILVQKEKDNILVKIKDEGIGIKASDQAHIFNRFYRSDSSRVKENFIGYGIGLSIAKRIIDLHDGKITVTSQPNEGSEFCVRLAISK